MRNQILCVAALLVAVLSVPVLAAEWTTPVPVASGINTQYNEMTPYLSYDGLSLYFASNNTGTYKIYEAKRSQPSGNFTSVNQVLSASDNVLKPWVSPDNLRMYYYIESGGWHIDMTQRASVNDPWSLGTKVPGLPSSSVSAPSLTSDELTIVFNNPSVGNWDMYIATRPDKNSAFGNIRSLSELNTASFSECNPFLSPDGLSLYFNANPAGQNYLYMATRQSLNDQFGAAQFLQIDYTQVQGGGWPAISSDGMALYFGAGPSSDLYVTYNIPEPATLLLLGLGAVIVRKRRR
jgi:PEP-CTERM motif/WD40-like Beta Propeller Repeat